MKKKSNSKSTEGWRINNQRKWCHSLKLSSQFNFFFLRIFSGDKEIHWGYVSRLFQKLRGRCFFIFQNSQKNFVNKITFCKISWKILAKYLEVFDEMYAEFKKFSGQCLTVLFYGFIFMLALSDFILRKHDFSGGFFNWSKTIIFIFSS